MRFVAYYRVSTAKQGASRLGLEAQRAACTSYNPIKEFVEVESGKNDDRKELQAALSYARQNNAVLVIAKLDRLSRNAHFITGIMQGDVGIRCADMPDADEFQLHLYAILAHKERKMISDRTKAALVAAKARGVRLGGAQQSTIQRIAAHDATLVEAISTIRAGGVVRLQAIADGLNAMGLLAPRGGQWHAMSIKRLIARLDGTKLEL